MEAGTLRDRIMLQRKVPTRDAIGAEVITWADVVEVWANAEPLSGREYISMRQSQSDVTTRFRIRWREGVNSTMRILWGGVVYRIAEPPINVGARNKEIELLCVAESSDA